jgi:type IV pilus assembly protein PilM
MIRLTTSQLQPIGLDIGFDSIKMLQLETVGPATGGSPQSLAVVAAGRQAFGPEVREDPHLRMPLAVEMMRRMFREHGFHGRRVVASLPREIVHVKNLRLPLIPGHELEAAVQYEAKNIFSFDTSEAQVRHLQAGEVRQGTDVRQEVIVLAVRHEDVDNYVEQLHRGGAIVESLDIESCALYRSVERFIRRREDEQEVHVIVDVGTRRSQVVIGKGRDISFLKSIDIGAQHLAEAIRQKLDISEEEVASIRQKLSEVSVEAGEAASAGRDPVRQAVFDATRSIMEDLGREIGLCLRYYSVTFRGQRPTRVKLAGGEGRNPHLQAVLNAALTIPVETARPLYSVDTSRMSAADRRGPMCEWTLALGLGLRLTPGPFAPRDGKPREDLSPAGSNVEVVDINEAMQAGLEPPAAEPSPLRGREREVAHA